MNASQQVFRPVAVARYCSYCAWAETVHLGEVEWNGNIGGNFGNVSVKTVVPISCSNVTAFSDCSVSEMLAY